MTVQIGKAMLIHPAMILRIHVVRASGFDGFIDHRFYLFATVRIDGQLYFCMRFCIADFFFGEGLEKRLR